MSAVLSSNRRLQRMMVQTYGFGMTLFARMVEGRAVLKLEGKGEKKRSIVVLELFGLNGGTGRCKGSALVLGKVLVRGPASVQLCPGR